MSSFERELEVARILEAVHPDVVFHCRRIDAAGIVNAADYLWRSVVRSTEALAKLSERFPVESLVVVDFYGGNIVDSTAARYAALGEVLALNAPSLVPLAPKVLRLPSILTRWDLRQLSQGQPAVAGTRFDLLESEAVTLCLAVAAEYKGRAVVVPTPGTSLGADQVAALLRSRPAPGPAPATSELLFAGEELKPSLISGAREVVGPVHPAPEEVITLARECAGAASQEAAAEVGERFRTLVLARGRTTGPTVDHVQHP
jgi:hypothetical protein